MGSNSIRLVIYDVQEKESAKISFKDIREVIDEKKIASLSAYVRDGVLSEPGIKRAINVLNRHLNCMSNFSCEKTAIFATAFLRNCSNSKEARHMIEKGIDRDIDLISGEDEAHLGFVGASIAKPIQNGILADMGGGSTELTVIIGGKDKRTTSLPVGSVQTYERYVSRIIPTADEQKRIHEVFSKHLGDYLDNIKNPPCELFGIGGSIRSAAKMVGALSKDSSTPRCINYEQLRDVLKLSAKDQSEFCHIAVKTVPERIHTVVPGCLMASCLMEQLDVKELSLRKFGLREGYLVERMLK